MGSSAIDRNCGRGSHVTTAGRDRGSHVAGHMDLWLWMVRYYYRFRPVCVDDLLDCLGLVLVRNWRGWVCKRFSEKIKKLK